MEWQPIETAPRDGQEFDAWAKDPHGGYRVTNVKWGYEDFSVPCDGPFFLENRALDAEPWRYRWQPCEHSLTHWMPLPEPPK
jgi:Protein of unknown function (DUF551)